MPLLNLRCGLLTEAFFAYRSCVASAAAANSDSSPEVGMDPRLSEMIRTLVVQMADWAASVSTSSKDGNGRRGTPLQALCELPWSQGAEEEALVGWLLAQVGTFPHLPFSVALVVCHPLAKLSCLA